MDNTIQSDYSVKSLGRGVGGHSKRLLSKEFGQGALMIESFKEII